MKKVLLLLALLGMVGLVGCKNNKKSTPPPPPPSSDMGMSSAPPPPPPAPASVEPVPVEMGPVDTGMPASTPGGRLYTIQKGDTLMKIAREQYGTASKYRDILNANPNITDPNKIKVGQQIVLP